MTRYRNATSTGDIVSDRRRLAELRAEFKQTSQDLAAIDRTIELLTSGREPNAADTEAFDRAIDRLARSREAQR